MEQGVLTSGSTVSLWQHIRLNKKILYLLVTLFLFFLFGFKDVLLLLNEPFPHLYAVSHVPVLSWEEVVVYLPFANRFSLTTLLPAAPAAQPTLSQLTNFPPLTLILQGMLFQWVFGSNVDAYLLTLHMVLPTAVFWTLFAIYRRYLAESWAMLLTFWGVAFFRNYSALTYLVGLIAGRADLINDASLSPLEITRLPAPAITFLLFGITFYATTRTHRLSQRQMLLYSFLWAAHIYIYLFNFIAGVLFWFGYLVFVRFLQDKELNWRQIGRTLLLNGVVVTAVISPILLRQTLFATPIDREIFQRMGLVVANAGPITSEWGVFLAYILPLAAILLVAWISYADYYEIIYRFAPVFLMIFVEIIILNLHLILGQFFQPYLFSVRIGNFFSRYLYFIPIFYFISLPPKARLHHRNRLSQLTTPLYRASVAFVLRWQWAIVALGIGVIALGMVTSGMRFVRNYETAVSRPMSLTADRFAALTADQPTSTLLVSADIGVNLLLPVLSPHETLLVSAFNNYIPEADILDRLLLFAHLLNWDEAQFLAFMLPSPSYDTFYTDNSYTVTPDILQEGFGYWLLFHRRQLTAVELAKYELRLRDQFASYDVVAGVERWGVTAVQSTIPPPASLSFQPTSTRNEMIVYQLNRE